MFEDYRKLFIDASGPFKKLTVAYGAARVLNPLVAAQMDRSAKIDAIKELHAFGFDIFRPVGGIIDDMIEELDVYALKVAETDNEFWNNVEGAQEYDSDLAKKAVENPDKYASKTWRDNPIETAR